MSYFVYIREPETGKVLQFGAYDEIPFIVAKDGTKFVDIPHFSPTMLKEES